MSHKVSIEEVLDLAAKIEKLPGRSDVKSNIIRAYRELSGAHLQEALQWYETNI